MTTFLTIVSILAGYIIGRYFEWCRCLNLGFYTTQVCHDRGDYHGSFVALRLTIAILDRVRAKRQNERYVLTKGSYEVPHVNELCFITRTKDEELDG